MNEPPEVVPALVSEQHDCGCVRLGLAALLGAMGSFALCLLGLLLAVNL